MAYAQDTIISANAANAYVTVLQGLLTDAGWTLEDSGTPSGTYRFQVWKSAGTLNECGYDWYLSIQWNSVGTEQTVDIIGGAAYDSVNKRISQIPARTSSPSNTGVGQYAETVTGDMWGWVAINTAVTALNTTATTSHGSLGSSQAKPWHSVVVPSSAFAYWMSVTLDHVGVFTTISNTYIVSTLDVAASWSAADFPVNTTPLISVIQVTTGTALTSEGFSAGIIGTGATTTNRIIPTYRGNSPIGAPLPILDGNYLDAYAWRRNYFLASATGGTANTPAWDNPEFGDGWIIGKIIDFYFVNGGAVGDTVTIDGATYVLTAPMAGRTVALLVE